MDELTKLVESYFSNANMRGVDPENPIPFTLTSPTGMPNEGKQFMLQVGYKEPTFNQRPYNILWISFEEGSPAYKKAYRRVSHYAHGGTPDLNYTWEEVLDIEDFYSKEQFYRSVADLDLVDQDPTVDPIGVATKDSFGTTKTVKDAVEPRAILNLDDRLTDARPPKDHNHPDFARTMLLAYHYNEDTGEVDENGDPILEEKRAFIKVDSAFPPSDGEILFIDSQISEHVWSAVWRKANKDDIEEGTKPVVVSITLIEPASAPDYGDMQTYKFEYEVEWSDGSTTIPTTGNWTVEANAAGITIDNTGLLDIPDLDDDTTLEVTIAEHGQTDSVTINIRNEHIPVVPTELVIEGATTVNEDSTEQYTVKMKFSDGSSNVVTPDSFVSSDTDVAIIDVDGLLTTYNVDSDQQITITAKYTQDGQEFTATHDINVIDLQVPLSLVITGATVMDELTSETYEVSVKYKDGSSRIVMPETFEIIQGGDHATLDELVLTANDVVGDQIVQLEATFTEKSIPLTTTHNVTVLDLDVSPVLFHVTYQTRMDENTDQTVVYEIEYSDGSKQPVVPDTVTSGDDTVLDVSADPVWSALEVDADTSVDVDVAVNVMGKDFGKKCTVQVINEVVVVPTGIELSGASSVDELQSTLLNVKLVHSDGSKTDLDDFANATFDSDNSSVVTLDEQAPQLKVTAGTVTSDTDVVITVDYDDGTYQFSDTHNLRINDVVKEPASWKVVGTSPVIVGEANSGKVSPRYRVEVTYDDGSTSLVDGLDWREPSGNYATFEDNVTRNGYLQFTIEETDVTAPFTFDIEGKYDLGEGAGEEWKSFTVQVNQIDVSDVTFTLTGDNNVDAGDTSNEFVAKWKIGSDTHDIATADVTLSFVGNAHGCTINQANNTITVPDDLSSDESVTVRGTFDWRDQTDVTADKSVNIKAGAPTFKSAEFLITKPEYEAGEVIDPTPVLVTYSDDSTRTVTAKTINLTGGSEAVNVSGTGGSTRFTVKPDNDKDTFVVWDGTVEVDGQTHNLDPATVKAKEKDGTPPLRTYSGAFNAPAFAPSEYENDPTKFLAYYDQGLDDPDRPVHIETTEFSFGSRTQFRVPNDSTLPFAPPLHCLYYVFPADGLDLDQDWTSPIVRANFLNMHDSAMNQIITPEGARQAIAGGNGSPGQGIGSTPYNAPHFWQFTHGGVNYIMLRDSQVIAPNMPASQRTIFQ